MIFLALGWQVMGVSLQFAAGEPITTGPLFHEFSLTLETGARQEALGPLMSHQQTAATRQGALPPFFSITDDAEVDSREIDFLYPVLTYDRFGAEYRWQLFQLLSFSGGGTQQGDAKDRFTLFPIYFQQRSADPDLNYTAVLPLYGHLKNRLFRDEIKFVLMPLYVQSRKRDVVTDNYLYPFFHLRHGNGLRGWQFWPLLGQEHKDVTTRTNGFGDVEILGGHDKFFALWPLFLKQQSGLGTDNPDSQLALLPLFSSQRSPQRDSTTVLWPFFTFTDDMAKQYREWDLPWPIIVVARGPGKTGQRLWPLFSQMHNDTLTSEFYLWPLYKYNHAAAGPLDRERTRILLFLYSDLIERNTTTGTALHRTDLWPLFTARRDHSGNERLQLLALLEPLLPNNKSIERDYSPLWSLWRSEKNLRTGASSQSLLWNLYRRDTTPETKKCSLLFGLFQYQSGPEGNRWRLFYVPFGKNKKSEPAPPIP